VSPIFALLFGNITKLLARAVSSYYILWVNRFSLTDTCLVRSCEKDHNRVGGGFPMALMWNRTVDWDADDWRRAAACRNTEPDLFFPVGTTGPAVDQIDAAKRVCRSCEALEPCLDFALATNQESGVWGGTSEEERRKLRKAWLAARRSQRTF
jgi:WhiB family redox-sensing transcriptional regulator